MHRTYSMRQSRAPTASQIENPPPQTSSTKNRLFGRGSLGKFSSTCRWRDFRIAPSQYPNHGLPYFTRPEPYVSSTACGEKTCSYFGAVATFLASQSSIRTGSCIYVELVRTQAFY
jgi:hypothetical protein